MNSKYSIDWKACKTCGHRLIECDQKGNPGTGYLACPVALEELRPERFGEPWRRRVHHGNPIEETPNHRAERLAQARAAQLEVFVA